MGRFDMRITYKALQEYFREYVAPIAPLLDLNTIQGGYTIRLLEEVGSGRVKKALVFQDTAKETMKWMEGFVTSYNYFRGDL
jgi:hypothetical protein